jgi:hypothetical protein
VILRLTEREMEAVRKANKTVESWKIDLNSVNETEKVEVEEVAPREREPSVVATVKLTSEPQIVVWNENLPGVPVLDTKVDSNTSVQSSAAGSHSQKNDDGMVSLMEDIKLDQKKNLWMEFQLTGVVFNQGINEMQTLANMSGGTFIQRQVEVKIVTK